MRKLALNDEILLSIQQPARYIGGEVNMVIKDPEKVDVRFAMCFPDVYEIGMSTWAFRFCIPCLTTGRTSAASGFIPRGQT